MDVSKMERTLDNIERITELCQSAALRCGAEFVDLEWVVERGRRILRVYFDRDGGINIAELTRISRILNDSLDVEDLIDGAYHLEVSSPGVERPLRTPEHFDRFAGNRIKITLKEPLDGRKNFTGRLDGLSEDQEQIVITVEEEGRSYKIPLKALKKARLCPV